MEHVTPAGKNLHWTGEEIQQRQQITSIHRENEGEKCKIIQDWKRTVQTVRTRGTCHAR
jgi:hypothetical protein